MDKHIITTQKTVPRRLVPGRDRRTGQWPEGFACFYRLIYDRPLPAHAKEEWLPLIYAARRQGKGALIEAFRGASKSSTLSVA